MTHHETYMNALGELDASHDFDPKDRWYSFMACMLRATVYALLFIGHSIIVAGEKRT
jgi:hypothetical protein